MSDKEIKTKTIEHPLEAEFNIEPGTTIVEYEETVPAELVSHETFDKKDDEIEDQFQEIYEKALDAFDTQSQEAELVEGKYKARNAEVAVQYLNTALNAAKEKSNMKQHKDKLEVTKEKAGTPHTQNNNLIVTDRNELLKMLQGKENESA